MPLVALYMRVRRYRYIPNIHIPIYISQCIPKSGYMSCVTHDIHLMCHTRHPTSHCGTPKRHKHTSLCFHYHTHPITTTHIQCPSSPSRGACMCMSMYACVCQCMHVYVIVYVYMARCMHVYVNVYVNLQIATAFVGGYCSIVQGLLDCFEVDLGLTELCTCQSTDSHS